MNDDPIVHVCAGPPLCEGPADTADMEACELCKHIICHRDGTETVLERKVH